MDADDLVSVYTLTDPGKAEIIKNALEATPEGGEVRVWCERDETRAVFRVWNEGELPASTRRRLFERYFTTKGGAGRGLGTYSMKLIGERCLGGEVGFDTSSEGTTFWICLPLRPQRATAGRSI